jgi:hypothetical protein
MNKENTIKELKRDNPEYNINIIDILGEIDPTENGEYMEFMVGTTKEWIGFIMKELKTQTFKEMGDIIKDFEKLKNENYIKNTDIYSYRNNREIADSVKIGKEVEEEYTN